MVLVSLNSSTSQFIDQQSSTGAMALPKPTLSVSDYDKLIRSNCRFFLGDSIRIDVVTEYAESSGWTAYVPVSRTNHQQGIISAKGETVLEVFGNLHKASAVKVRSYNQGFFPIATQERDKKKRKHPGGRTSHASSDSEEEEFSSSDDEGGNLTPHASPDPIMPQLNRTVTNQQFIPLPPRNVLPPPFHSSLAHMMQQHTLTPQKGKWFGVKFTVTLIIKSTMYHKPIRCLCATTLDYTEILGRASRIVAREYPRLPVSHVARIESVKADDDEYSIENGTQDLLRLPIISMPETLQVVVSW